jgi:hypothetical protein
MELFFAGLGDEGCGMSEKIWSADYIRENPELAAKAIETLQTALDDRMTQIRNIRTLLDALWESLADREKVR